MANFYPTLKSGDKIKCFSLHNAYALTHAIYDKGYRTKIEQKGNNWIVTVGRRYKDGCD